MGAPIGSTWATATRDSYSPTAMLAEERRCPRPDSIRIALRVKVPHSPDVRRSVPTMIDSNEGSLHFQEYLVKRRTEPVVKGIRFAGVESAQPAPGVLEAIRGRRPHPHLPPQSPDSASARFWPLPQVRDQLRAHKEKVFRRLPHRRRKS